MENMTPCRAASRTSGAMRPAASATSSADSQGVSDAPGSTVRRWGAPPPTSRAASSWDWYRPPLGSISVVIQGSATARSKVRSGKRCTTPARASRFGRQAFPSPDSAAPRQVWRSSTWPAPRDWASADQVAEFGIVKLVAPGVGYRAVDHGCPPDALDSRLRGNDES